MPEYFSTRQLCERFDISDRTLFNWRMTRDFPAPINKSIGRSSVYLREDVYAWERQHILCDVA